MRWTGQWLIQRPFISQWAREQGKGRWASERPEGESLENGSSSSSRSSPAAGTRAKVTTLLNIQPKLPLLSCMASRWSMQYTYPHCWFAQSSVPGPPPFSRIHAHLILGCDKTITRKTMGAMKMQNKQSLERIFAPNAPFLYFLTNETPQVFPFTACVKFYFSREICGTTDNTT